MTNSIYLAMYIWQIKILESVIIVTCNIINCLTGLTDSR